MSKFYAQIDTDNIVTGISETHSAIDEDRMIELEGYELDKLGNLYNPVTGTFTPQPDPPVRTITTQAFYRRMTQGERTSMRAASPDVADLRDDLDRSPQVDLDGTIEQQLQNASVFTQTRIDELLVDGTPEETPT